MTIQFNGVPISDVRVKSNPVSSVYIGSELVWTRFVPTAPEINIVSLTQGVAANEPATCVATTDKPETPIRYAFEIEFSQGNWLTLQDSTSPTWNPNDDQLVGFQYRCRAYSTNEYGTGEDYAIGGRISAPVVSGPVQAMTWLMTAADAAAIDSAGLEIIDPTNTTSLKAANGPRFWNGTESNSYGATNNTFISNADCRAWWEDNYQARIRQNGRDWILTDRSPGLMYVNASTTYNNIGNSGDWNNASLGSWWIDQAQGQTIDIEMYAKGQLPDNWYTYQQGAGVVTDGLTGNNSFDINPNYPNPTATAQLKAYGSPIYSVPIFSQYMPNDSTMPQQSEYVAVYITDEIVGNVYYGSTKTAGWYVFGPKYYESNGCRWDALAWPTGGSDGTGSTGMISGTTGPTPGVLLSDYTGATGNGGTDGWSSPYGSLLDWDTTATELTIAADTQNGTSVQVVPSYDSNPGRLDQYAQDGTSAVEVTLFGWAAAEQLKVFMSATINTTPFAADLPYAAHWMEQEGRWRKLTADDRGGSKTDMRYSFIDGDYPDYNFNNMGQPDQALLFFAEDPGDVGKWRPYDGPTS